MVVCSHGPSPCQASTSRCAEQARRAPPVAPEEGDTADAAVASPRLQKNGKRMNECDLGEMSSPASASSGPRLEAAASVGSWEMRWARGKRVAHPHASRHGSRLGITLAVVTARQGLDSSAGPCRVPFPSFSYPIVNIQRHSFRA